MLIYYIYIYTPVWEQTVINNNDDEKSGSLPELFANRAHSKNDVKIVPNTVDEEGKDALGSILNSLLLCIFYQTIANLYKKSFQKTFIKLRRFCSRLMLIQ